MLLECCKWVILLTKLALSLLPPGDEIRTWLKAYEKIKPVQHVCILAIEILIVVLAVISLLAGMLCVVPSM